MDTSLTGAAGGTGLNSQALLDQQAATQQEAMAFQTASTDQSMQFQMHSAAEKNRAAVMQSMTTSLNTLATAIGRA